MRALSLFVLLLVPFLAGAQSAPASAEWTTLPVPELYAGGPPAPAIASGDFPYPERWYAPADATFIWQLPPDVTAVAADLATSSGAEPMTTYRPPVSSVTIPAEDLTEGTHYLSVQFRNEEKWGMFAERVIKIDATPPEPFSITAEPVVGGAVAYFEARDALSGVSHYEVSVDNGPAVRLTPADARQGYVIDLKNGGRRTVAVAARDQAGNTRTETLSVFGIAPAAAAPANVVEAAVDDPASVLAAILAAVTLLTFGYLVYERQRYARSLRDLRRETGEIHDQLLRIFSALRQEIYEQVRNISKKPRLSKKEQETIDSLDRALSVSETLIEREIKDVKKLLD